MVWIVLHVARVGFVVEGKNEQIFAFVCTYDVDAPQLNVIESCLTRHPYIDFMWDAFYQLNLCQYDALQYNMLCQVYQ